jgi:hypothetical protein
VDDSSRAPADLMAIRHLVGAYASCCDRRDGDGFAALFAPGAVFESASRSITSPEELRAIPGILLKFTKTYHTVMNHQIVLDGDRAEGELYSASHHLTPRDDGRYDDLLMYITYRDRYVRGEPGWQFEYRTFTVEFTEQKIVDSGERLAQRQEEA